MHVRWMIGGVRPALTAAAVAMALWTSPAQAHAKLLASDPAANSTGAVPKNIHLQFSEAIAKNLSSAVVTNSSGRPVATMSMNAQDAKSMDSMPMAAMPAGVYTVTWTAVSSDDGYKISGQFTFTVK